MSMNLCLWHRLTNSSLSHCHHKMKLKHHPVFPMFNGNSDSSLFSLFPPGPRLFILNLQIYNPPTPQVGTQGHPLGEETFGFSDKYCFCPILYSQNPVSSHLALSALVLLLGISKAEKIILSDFYFLVFFLFFFQNNYCIVRDLNHLVNFSLP